MRKLLFPLCTLGCVWALLALATWDLKSIRTRPTSLADIFQLKKPVDNFMSALIVDPTLGCDFNCDKNVRKADRLYHEKVKIEKKKEALIAKLKKERDSLERTLFEKAIGFHRDQLTRAVDKAKSVIQENSDIKQRSISRKIRKLEAQSKEDVRVEREHRRRQQRELEYILIHRNRTYWENGQIQRAVGRLQDDIADEGVGVAPSELIRRLTDIRSLIRRTTQETPDADCAGRAPCAADRAAPISYARPPPVYVNINAKLPITVPPPPPPATTRVVFSPAASPPARPDAYYPLDVGF